MNKNDRLECNISHNDSSVIYTNVKYPKMTTIFKYIYILYFFSGVYKVVVDDNHVHTYNNSGIFGELALLYNMPR